MWSLMRNFHLAATRAFHVAPTRISVKMRARGRYWDSMKLKRCWSIDCFGFGAFQIHCLNDFIDLWCIQTATHSFNDSVSWFVDLSILTYDLNVSLRLSDLLTVMFFPTFPSFLFPFNIFLILHFHRFKKSRPIKISRFH